MEKRFHIKWWILLLLCIPVLYIAIQLFAVMYRSYVTETVREDILSDSLDCRGILGMSETEVLYDGSGILGYTVQNGERVSAGAVVAEAFTTTAQAQQSAKARAITQELDTLNKSTISAAGTDTEMLMAQTYRGVCDFLDLVSGTNYKRLAADKAEVQLAANKTQVVIGAQSDFSERIAMLTAQRDAAQQAGTGLSITAPVGGYFVAGEDSRKRLYTTQQLQEMPPAELSAAAQEDAQENAAAVAGKIIEDYRWRFFASVTPEQAEKFVVGAQVQVSFPDVSNEKIPAAVVAVTLDEDAGLAKVELLCDYINADVVTLEHARARITFRSYAGLRIDKRALRVVDGVDGVYIRHGNVAYFARINIIYEDANYLLVPLEQVDGENEVKRYDEAIVEGR
ncbi:MAG: HlyD family efflux transporter periplasmic adaptor subunit, partial [Ruthenibacterium sp.]